MNRRRAMAVMGLAVTNLPKTGGLVGVWKLVSCEREMTNGRIDRPLGEQPVGRLIYDAGGRVSVQLMRAGRRAEAAKAARTSWEAAEMATCDEIREMVAGYLAYFGTYEVDEATRTVSHTVLGSLIPAWVGTNRKRTYELEGDALRMTLQRGETTERYVWRRE